MAIHSVASKAATMLLLNYSGINIGDAKYVNKICGITKSRVMNQQQCMNLSGKRRDGSLKGVVCRSSKSIRSVERSGRFKVRAFTKEQGPLVIKSRNAMKKNAGELTLKFFF